MVPEDAIKKGLDFYKIYHDIDTLRNLCIFIEELKKWNEHINLTGLKDIESMIKRLLYDAFFVYTSIEKDHSILDMGSGAGIISIPSAIINRDMHVYSVDKSTKKIHFQRHIKRLLGLERFYPLRERIEDIKDIKVDTVTVKGFGAIEDILSKGAGILQKGGRMVILKGKDEEPIKFRGFSLKQDMIYSLPDTEKTYRLFIYAFEKDIG